MALASLLLSGVLTLVIALALKAVMGWRVADEDEISGIDGAEHAESGYDFGGLGARGAGSTPAHAGGLSSNIPSTGTKATEVIA